MENESLMKNICCHFDTDETLCGNWKKLLELLNKEKILNYVNYSQFRSYLHGGGSPTKALLDAIMAKWPGLPLSVLIAKLKIINRNDVAADLTAVMKKRKCELSLETLHWKRKTTL